MKTTFRNVKIGGQFSLNGVRMRRTSMLCARNIHSDSRVWVSPWTEVGVITPLPPHMKDSQGVKVVVYEGFIGDQSPDPEKLRLKCIPAPTYLRGQNVVYVHETPEVRDSCLYLKALARVRTRFGNDYQDSPFWQVAREECLEQEGL